MEFRLIISIWANNETKLTNTIALRSEIDLIVEYGVVHITIQQDRNGLVLTLEPRLYFNLQKRNSDKLKTEK